MKLSGNSRWWTVPQRGCGCTKTTQVFSITTNRIQFFHQRLERQVQTAVNWEQFASALTWRSSLRSCQMTGEQHLWGPGSPRGDGRKSHPAPQLKLPKVTSVEPWIINGKVNFQIMQKSILPTCVKPHCLGENYRRCNQTAISYICFHMFIGRSLALLKLCAVANGQQGRIRGHRCSSYWGASQ